MARWGVFSGVLGVAALLAVAGCDVQVKGAAVADPVAMSPVSVEQAFGNADTVDPCSVVDVNALPRDLDGSLETADSLDDCPVSVTLSDGTKIDVRVGPLETQDEESDSSLKPVATLTRGMTLYTSTDNAPGLCDEYLGFSDANALLIDATTSDPSSKADACPAAEAVGRNAATQIAAGGIKHITFPGNSAGRIDPCNLVVSDTLASAGIANAVASEYPEMHECFWGPGLADSTGNSMYLEFVVGEEPSILDPTTDTSSTIAGRPTVDTKFAVSSTSAWCDVETGLRTYGDPSDDLVEIALIEMHVGDGNTAHACTMANKIAASVWPQLPQAG